MPGCQDPSPLKARRMQDKLSLTIEEVCARHGLPPVGSGGPANRGRMPMAPPTTDNLEMRRAVIRGLILACPTRTGALSSSQAKSGWDSALRNPLAPNSP